MVLGNVVLSNLIFAGVMVVVFGGLALKIKMDMAKREIKNWSKELEEIRQEDERILQEDAEHRAMLDSWMEERYGTPLDDDEIEKLQELMERAKRDDRFKELANMDTWCVNYEVIMINCKKLQKKIDKYSDQGEC